MEGFFHLLMPLPTGRVCRGHTHTEVLYCCLWCRSQAAVVEELLMAHGTGVPHVHEAPHAEGDEAAAQEAPVVPEAVCAPLSRVLMLACTLLTLLGGPQLFGAVLQSRAESHTSPLFLGSCKDGNLSGAPCPAGGHLLSLLPYIASQPAREQSPLRDMIKASWDLPLSLALSVL